MFQVPDSDDLPSTPPRDPHFFVNPPKSTTPSHEPPTYLTNISTTPEGPPPRSFLGSSINANNTFPRGRGTPLKRFALPQSSPPHEEDEDAEGEDDDMLAHSFAPRAGGGLDSAMFNSMMNSPRGLKRSRNGKVQPRHKSDMPAIARGLAKQSGPASLEDSCSFPRVSWRPRSSARSRPTAPPFVFGQPRSSAARRWAFRSRRSRAAWTSWSRRRAG